jgi:parafibromin
MASIDVEQNDALLNLRQAIATNQEPILTTSADPSVAADVQPDLAKATHIHFSTPNGHKTFPLDTCTRFIFPPSDQGIDLRSVYFAWQHRDDPTQSYVSATTQLNNALSSAAGAGGKIRNLGFAERLELKSWLDGSSEESENIKPLEAQKAAAQAAGSAAVASGVAGGIAPVTGAGIAAPAVKGSKSSDPRLAEIYRGERKMGDRNTILRGIKPTVYATKLEDMRFAY